MLFVSVFIKTIWGMEHTVIKITKVNGIFFVKESYNLDVQNIEIKNHIIYFSSILSRFGVLKTNKYFKRQIKQTTF